MLVTPFGPSDSRKVFLKFDLNPVDKFAPPQGKDRCPIDAGGISVDATISERIWLMCE